MDYFEIKYLLKITKVGTGYQEHSSFPLILKHRILTGITEIICAKNNPLGNDHLPVTSNGAMFFRRKKCVAISY